jgi:hypothetical protein
VEGKSRFWQVSKNVVYLHGDVVGMTIDKVQRDFQKERTESLSGANVFRVDLQMRISPITVNLY